MSTALRGLETPRNISLLGLVDEDEEGICSYARRALEGMRPQGIIRLSGEASPLDIVLGTLVMINRNTIVFLEIVQDVEKVEALIADGAIFCLEVSSNSGEEKGVVKIYMLPIGFTQRVAEETGLLRLRGF